MLKHVTYSVCGHCPPIVKWWKWWSGLRGIIIVTEQLLAGLFLQTHFLEPIPFADPLVLTALLTLTTLWKAWCLCERRTETEAGHLVLPDPGFSEVWG